MPDGGASIYAAIAAWYAAASWVTIAAYAVMAASVAYSAYTLATIPDMPGYSAEIRGRTQIVRSAVTAHRIIYGEVMVSGPLVAAFATSGAPRPDSEKLALGYIQEGPGIWRAPR